MTSFVEFDIETDEEQLLEAFNEAMEAGDLAKAETAFREFCSGMDKAVKGGVMSRNTAIRGKTRAANRLRAATTAAAAAQ